MLSSVKRQPFQSTFRVIFSCEQSRGILPLGRNCCQTMMVERMPIAEPQPFSGHFWLALFFVLRLLYKNKDCKAWAASHPGLPCRGGKGWRLVSRAWRAEYGLLGQEHGEDKSCQVMALRRPYLCPKTRNESEAVPGGFVTGQWIILPGTELGGAAAHTAARPQRRCR